MDPNEQPFRRGGHTHKDAVGPLPADTVEHTPLVEALEHPSTAAVRHTVADTGGYQLVPKSLTIDTSGFLRPRPSGRPRITPSSRGGALRTSPLLLEPSDIEDPTPSGLGGMPPSGRRGITQSGRPPWRTSFGTAAQITPSARGGVTPSARGGVTPSYFGGITPSDPENVTPSGAEGITPEIITIRGTIGTKPSGIRGLTPSGRGGITPSGGATEGTTPKPTAKVRQPLGKPFAFHGPGVHVDPPELVPDLPPAGGGPPPNATGQNDAVKLRSGKPTKVNPITAELIDMETPPFSRNLEEPSFLHESKWKSNPFGGFGGSQESLEMDPSSLDRNKHPVKKKGAGGKNGPKKNSADIRYSELPEANDDDILDEYLFSPKKNKKNKLRFSNFSLENLPIQNQSLMDMGNGSIRPSVMDDGIDLEATGGPEDHDEEKVAESSNLPPILRRENRNVWSIEAFQPTEDRMFSRKLASSLNPFLGLAAIFGRFPLTYHYRTDGTLIYRFNYRSCPAIMFCIMGILTILLALNVAINSVSIMTTFPKSPNILDETLRPVKIWRVVRSEEVAIYKRNYVIMGIFILNLTHLTVAHVAFFLKREYIARYFAYWGEVVELLRLDVADGLLCGMLTQMLVLIGMFSILLTMLFLNYFSAVSGGGGAIGMLLTRVYNPAIHESENFWVLRYIGGVLFAYVFVSSKLFMLYFFYRCRLIKNLFIVWNRRFNICVNGPPGYAMKVVRSTRAYLFKDHIVTLNLIEGANHEFVLILESYLLCAMINMVLELHHGVRAFYGPEFKSNRKLDIIPLFCYLAFDFYIFFIACLEAGRIPEQARVAFDIVKRKGMMRHGADQELWFMLSMRISFSGAAGVQGVGITAGDFIYLTKTFILIAVGLMTSHFIIVWQFEWELQQSNRDDPFFDDVNMTSLLGRVEGTKHFWT